MKKKGICLLPLFLAAALSAGCQNEQNGGETLTILNYGKYFDPAALKLFEEETGIKIEYEE